MTKIPIKEGVAAHKSRTRRIEGEKKKINCLLSLSKALPTQSKAPSSTERIHKDII